MCTLFRQYLHCFIAFSMCITKSIWRSRPQCWSARRTCLCGFENMLVGVLGVDHQPLPYALPPISSSNTPPEESIRGTTLQPPPSMTSIDKRRSYTRYCTRRWRYHAAPSEPKWNHSPPIQTQLDCAVGIVLLWAVPMYLCRNSTVDTLTQQYVFIPFHMKHVHLVHILHTLESTCCAILIFCEVPFLDSRRCPRPYELSRWWLALCCRLVVVQ